MTRTLITIGLTLAVLGFLAVCALLAVAAASAQTNATITPTLSTIRPGARAGLTVAVGYSGGESGVPSPLRRAILRFPAGMSLNIPKLSSCTAAHLRAHGAKGCPKQSEIGTGHALAETLSGALILTEHITLSAFLGYPSHGQPTFEILGQGYTPKEERLVFTGRVLQARPPYGEELVVAIPPIPTLPLEPDASMLDFSLSVGAAGRHISRGANTVLVPSRCPAGGFPFSAEFTYADGSMGSALASVPCH